MKGNFHVRFLEEPTMVTWSCLLGGRKALLKSDMEDEVVLVDASETQIERPKKGYEIKNG